MNLGAKRTNSISASNKFIAIYCIILSICNVQSMEENCNAINNIINTNRSQLIDHHNESISDYDEEKESNYHSLINKHAPKLSAENLRHNNIIHNSVVYNSNNNMIRNIVKNIKKYPTEYKPQQLEGFKITMEPQYNQEYEKYLFSIDDSYLISKGNINTIQNDIDTIVKDVILDRNDDDVLYINKTEEEKIKSLYNSIVNYYNSHAEYIFDHNIRNNQNIQNSNNIIQQNNNCIAKQYNASKTYIPFKLLQIIYSSIKKYGENIAYKTINRIYNYNRDQVHNYFKGIYENDEFNPEVNKKNKGFLGTYSLNNIPNHKELDKLKGKALADYWEYANHSIKMFPSINIHYTDEYLQEAHKRWTNNIQFTLNNIIEQNINNRPIDSILNYYTIVANRAPNIYLSNDVIDFIHKKLGINDTIYFIDKFIKTKQQYLTEDDLPNNDAYFPNILNEYPNGNIKEYKVNIYNNNCIVYIFNSSDQYNSDGVNRIIIDNGKEELYNRIVSPDTIFNIPRWHINKYYKINREGNKEYNTVFLYYIR